MIVVIMGVTGSGKTTVGVLLAKSLGWRFIEADDFHSPDNVEKMRRGEPLTDADREPWLARLAANLKELDAGRESAVLACSALKHSYRETLRSSGADVRFVYLRVTRSEATERVQDRRGHFMPSSLVDSQFDTLEEPSEALDVDASKTPEVIVEEIRHFLSS